MDNLQTSWKIFLLNAQNFLLSGEKFLSPVRGHRYKIIDVNERSVTVRRLSVDGSKDAKVTFHTFKRIINAVNDAKGFLDKKVIDDIFVAKRATVVRLTPQLDWDPAGKFIIESEELMSQIRKATSETPAYLKEKVQRWLTLRRGQNKLRSDLLDQYDSRCCITGCGIEEILDAAHIEPYSVNGNSSSTNALLLRSDLHDLFDSFLLGIHPKTLAIHLSVKLRNTEYVNWEGKVLKQRKDDVSLDMKSLQMRWDLFEEIQEKASNIFVQTDELSTF